MPQQPLLNSFHQVVLSQDTARDVHMNSDTRCRGSTTSSGGDGWRPPRGTHRRPDRHIPTRERTKLGGLSDLVGQSRSSVGSDTRGTSDALRQTRPDPRADLISERG